MSKYIKFDKYKELCLSLGVPSEMETDFIELCELLVKISDPYGERFDEISKANNKLVRLIEENNQKMNKQLYSEDGTGWFVDKNLAKRVYDVLETSSTVVTREELEGIRNIYWYKTDFTNQIHDISGIENLKNLNHLDLGNNQISDITPLSGLKNLNHLDLDFNQISDISPISGLKNLNQLGLANNQIVDISPLSSLTKLENSNLGNNQISDITPLSGLKNLSLLNLAHNQIRDTSALSGLKNLIVIK